MRERLGAGREVELEGRLLALGVGILLVFALFVGRLVQLQLAQGAEHRMRSQRNSIRTVRLAAPRGQILDREGRVLAGTRAAFDLAVMPSQVRGSDLTYRALGQLVDADVAALRERVEARRGRQRFQPLVVRADLAFDSLARVETHRHALGGVFTEVRPQREYRAGELAAHLLGTLGEVRGDQLETEAFADYRPGDIVGQTGLESMLEPTLRGRDGGRNVIVDVAGREVERLDEVSPVPGRDVVLTLDLDLQRAAQEAFQSADPGEPDRMGAIVALDPRNGDVLALVSRPGFDPNDFAGGVDAATWQSLVTDEWRPLQNRAISGQYPPGSTYKAIVALAGLESGLLDPGTRVYCPGSFSHGNRSYRCWKKGGHGSVDLQEALKKSCDVFFYALGLRLGVDRIAEFARAFGFGARTGIGLRGETTGIVPSSEWKQKRFGEPWYSGETVSVSIGQGYNTATPIQLAVAFAAIANGGTVHAPRLVLRRMTPDGPVEEAPQPRGRVPVDPEHLARVRRALRAVVEEAGGTGSRARVPGVEVAGKTGTSQVVRLDRVKDLPESQIPRRFKDHAWFASFAPVDAPEIVVVVLAEHGGGGGATAAPMARQVLQRHFEKQGRVAQGTATAALRVPRDPAPARPTRAAPPRLDTDRGGSRRAPEPSRAEREAQARAEGWVLPPPLEAEVGAEATRGRD